MNFIKIRSDRIVQTDDLFRIDLRSSILDFTLIDKIEIEVEDLAALIEIPKNKKLLFLDHAYETDGVKVIKVIVTFLDTSTKEKELTVSCLLPEDDNLFSSDQDILETEPDIMRYLRDGRSSFNYAHREAQTRIMAFLDEQRIWKQDGTRYVASDIVDIEEFKHWSRFYVLHIIYSALQVSADDIFQIKATNYADMMSSARKRATIRLEFDDANNLTKSVDRVTSVMVRR